MLITRTRRLEIKNSTGDLTIPPPKADEKYDGSVNAPSIKFDGKPI